MVKRSLENALAMAPIAEQVTKNMEAIELKFRTVSKKEFSRDEVKKIAIELFTGEDEVTKKMDADEDKYMSDAQFDFAGDCLMHKVWDRIHMDHDMSV